MPAISSTEGPRPLAHRLVARRRWFLWVVLTGLVAAVVLAVTVNFRIGGFTVSALLVVVGLMRAFGREEVAPFAARGRRFDAVVLLLGAAAITTLSIVARD